MNSFPPSSSSTEVSEGIHPNHKEHDCFITITEKIKLKKDQHEVLKILCNTYQTSFSEYIQEALVEAMKFDIEEGNFCDTLLEKIDNDDKSKNNSSSAHLAPNLMNNDLDMLKKLQAQKQ
jgi:hypothetical protein